MTSSGLPKLWTNDQRSQNSEFQSHFSVSRIGRNFPKKNSVKNIWLEDQLILMKFFENFDFYSTLFTKIVHNFFVGFVHNFGKTNNDII